jgi:hypothetical protein
MVNSAGMSTSSAISFTPPSEMSVIMQSRGNEPVPNLIRDTSLHGRRSLLRRLTNMVDPYLSGSDASFIQLPKKMFAFAKQKPSQFI